MFGKRKKQRNEQDNTETINVTGTTVDSNIIEQAVNENKNIVKKSITKLIIGVSIFFIPTIVNVLIN